MAMSGAARFLARLIRAARIVPAHSYMSNDIKEITMAELKTKRTDEGVETFLGKVDDEGKRQDSRTIIELMRKATKAEPKMWGPNIIGFGDLPFASAANPSLTTIRPPGDLIGRETARLLLARMGDEDKGAEQVVDTHFVVVQRQST